MHASDADRERVAEELSRQAAAGAGVSDEELGLRRRDRARGRRPA